MSSALKIRVALAALATASFITGSCARHKSTTAPAIQRIVQSAKPPNVPTAVWTDVRKFYDLRHHEPAWVHVKPGAHANAAMKLLDSAGSHGFSAADYGEPDLRKLMTSLESDDDKPERDRASRRAEFDVRVTSALLAFGRDVAIGRTTPEQIDAKWKPRRQVPDLAGTLSEAVAGDVVSWTEKIQPQHPEYVVLQKALVALDAQRNQGDWPTVSAKALKPGRPDRAVIALRQRLVASGELKSDPKLTQAPAYDANVETAVRAFQEHHGLKATGIADEATIAAMNVPLGDRVEQLAENLERWRWMPDDFGARHFIVNIPQYHLYARENGKVVKDIRVIVGQPGKETPIFSAQMTTVVFSPYWNIPDSIAEGETVPAIAKDPSYLSRNNIEILRVTKSGASQIDPSKVDWNDADSLKELSFRQKPGAKNALGHVKFLFPNSFNVYLHDTPADALFARTGRAFSHGCIRVEEPEELAKYVLRGYSEWDEAHILEAMNAGVEKQVKLKEPLPVHIVYFTAWVDDVGGIHFQPDVYGYDQKQRSKT